MAKMKDIVKKVQVIETTETSRGPFSISHAEEYLGLLLAADEEAG